MSTLKDATQRCMQLFAAVDHKSHAEPGEQSDGKVPDSLEDEYDRFKVWSGNLGAQQKGHASLDWRLQDAETMSSSILKLLKILIDHLENSKPEIWHIGKTLAC